MKKENNKVVLNVVLKWLLKYHYSLVQMISIMKFTKVNGLLFEWWKSCQ